MILKYAYMTLLIKSVGNISIGRTAAITEGRAVAQDVGYTSARQIPFSLSCTESCSCSCYLCGGKMCSGMFHLETMQMQWYCNWWNIADASVMILKRVIAIKKEIKRQKLKIKKNINPNIFRSLHEEDGQKANAAAYSSTLLGVCSSNCGCGIPMAKRLRRIWLLSMAGWAVGAEAQGTPHQNTEAQTDPNSPTVLPQTCSLERAGWRSLLICLQSGLLRVEAGELYMHFQLTGFL